MFCILAREGQFGAHATALLGQAAVQLIDVHAAVPVRQVRLCAFALVCLPATGQN